MIWRATARAAEVVFWLALIWVCVLAVTGTDQHTQTLTATMIWAAPQMAGMILAPIGQGVSRWIDASRFVIADWVVLLFVADVLALALVSSHRWAEGWQPRVRLGEWMEFPRLPSAQPAPLTVAAVDEIDRRLAAWGRVAASHAWIGATFVGAWFAERAIPDVGRATQKGVHAIGAAGRRVATAPRRIHGGIVAVVPPEPSETLRRSEKNVLPRSNRPERLAS